MIKGIIFDFNGTLFWDAKLHEKAFNLFTEKYDLRKISEIEMKLHIHGRSNKDILEFIFQNELSKNEVIQFAEEKESTYRGLVIADKSSKLAPGAIQLLDYLKAKDFPMTIATSSDKTNVDFFFKHFDLHKWFDRSKTVYNNGTFQSKPAPDIFLIAAKNINIPITNCMILEDALAGVQAAKSSGAERIVFVENNAPIAFNEVKEFVTDRIKNFSQVKNLFQN